MPSLPHVLSLSVGILQPVSFEESPIPEVRLVYQPSAPLSANITGHLSLRSYFGIRTSDFGTHNEYVPQEDVALEAGLTLYWTLPTTRAINWENSL